MKFIAPLTKLKKLIKVTPRPIIVESSATVFSTVARPRSDRMIKFKMRLLVSWAAAIVLCFLLHVVAGKTKQDEWNDLLSRFRHMERKDNQNHWELQDESGAVEDDKNGEWERLVNVEGSEENAALLAEEEEEDLDGEKPIRGASLAFVFDSTGSMMDELDQVKAGATQILAALRDHPDAPIYNYIWVPFSDPGIGPVTVTTDDKLFQDRMQDVMVFGGGDCPEMSIGAIKKALEVALPNSYVYVFTDASAKDHRLTNEVLSLVQRKQAQVVFILTDDCLDRNEPNYKAYEKIAGTSSGQIYRLSKSEVKEVLKYVKVALQPHVVSLVSLNKPAPDKTSPDKVEVLIDESLKQFTVSVSGENATLNVTDPKGTNIDGPPKLENVLNLKNIKIVNVKEPDPGSWSVFINSDSNYTVRSTGLSKINFNHGFSTVETVNLKETNYRPLKGARSFILIQTSDTEKVYNLTSVDFVNLNGDVIQHLQLTPVSGMPGLYKGGSFVPPPEFFYLGVSGFGQDGLPIKRITSTAVSGQLPEKPIITMRTKGMGRVNTQGTLKCFVESVVPFTVRWYKDGVFIGNEQNCSETCEVLLHIEKLTLRSEGTYSCTAKNVAGLDSKSLNLTILEDAPSVRVNSPVVVSLGETVYLDCLVESAIPYVVKWTQFTVKNRRTGILHPSSTGTKLENNTLMIESAKPEDEGWYVCVAANKGGESQKRVLLVIQEPLKVKVEPGSITFAEGDSARFVCSASGKPQPRLEWSKDQKPIKDEDSPSIFIDEINGNLNLMIDYLEKRNAGVYVCNAVNSEASASASGELIYTEKPKVKAKENNLMVKAGLDVVLQCAATGYPEPTITWYKREDEIANNSRFQLNDGSLTIRSARSTDDGEYSCVAKNDRGSDVDYIGLIVGSAPTFLQRPRDKKIQINHNGTVVCSAIGVPQPEIKWRRSDGQELDESRMFVLSSGTLKITRMKMEDAGRYLCTAENVFGIVRNEVSIKVIGVEKPVPDKNVELRNVEADSGSEVTIPCGIVLGTPPAKVKWFKNGVELKPNDQISIEYSGNLVIQNATAEDRGNYSCLAQNAAGNSSRPYEVLISESPKIKETNETGIKGTVGGEIIIPCPVEGYPPPTVTWTRNGLPLPTSSTIFQDDNGSLIIRNLNEENAGTYVCTAINAAGSTSKATSIHVQAPPVFPTDDQDLVINVVEGHVVVLNCNVSAIPEPTIKWFKNEEQFPQDGHHTKLLRFVANTDDTGVFKCVAENEAGTSFKEFNVTILVPPKILARNNEESLKAKAGNPITLLCNVFGVPAPTVLWQRNGMYLTQNTSDITISDSGSLTIQNVTEESAGAYTCDAENPGGITQRKFYLQVNYAPKIIEEENGTRNITLKEGEEYSLTCLVEGNPKPNVIWKKNGLPILGQQHDLIILEDHTLVFLQVSRETTGLYKCEATSPEGSAFKEHEIQVLIPPTLTSDFFPTRLEVNEGDSLALTCPTSYSIPSPNIQWIKDGEPLDLLLHERSDEAQMKLSLDQRTLMIVEAHPSDRGNYSCVATNVAGRTDARFLVDVLMTPHFEEFNHVAHRTILTGGEVVLNCSVSGNPQPKVTWRKEDTPITPHNTPGVHVSLDKQHLVIFKGRTQHTGTYICLAANKVNTKEREFYVTVLEPPQITGPLQQMIDVMTGDNVTLDCHASGVPQPTFNWTKEEETKKSLNITEAYLRIINVTCEDSGIYLCDVSNTAGTRTKYFELNVLEVPEIENRDRVDDITSVVGGNITMKCKMSGHPKPDVTWLHNGHILNKVKKRSIEEDRYSGEWEFTDDGYVSLTLTNVQQRNNGIYTLLASNKAGVVEKKFNLQVLVPPKLLDGYEETEHVTVVHPYPVVLKCPVRGEPVPSVLWYKDNTTGEPLTRNENILVNGLELRIKKANSSHAGVFVCVAENPGGSVVHYFNVTVVEPPTLRGTHVESLNVPVNDTLTLHCNSTGYEDMKRSWFHSSEILHNSTDVTITHSGRILEIRNIRPKDSGVYVCLTSNVAGSAEIRYRIDVLEPPALSDHTTAEHHKVVQLHHPFALYCFLTGYPPPEIMWFKDGSLFNPNQYGNVIQLDSSYLSFTAGEPKDAGNYKCVARNSAGVQEMHFKVDIVVLGEWTSWSAWSECSVSCGLGEQVRKRSCDLGRTNTDTRVIVDKTSCKGDDSSRRKCFKECQVDENWGSWSTWTPCSVTCGSGIRRRRRLCNNSGALCKGDDSMKETCFEVECPINGQWSEWSNWSECSDPCGGGVMQRVRKCNSPSPQHGGEDCPGWGSELKICNRNKCRESERWLPWSEWGPCSKTCGKGQKRRYRSCKLAREGDTCKGENLQIEKCFMMSCYNSAFPSAANLHVRGKLNGVPVDNRVDVSIENLQNERQIFGHMNDIIRQKDKWFPYAPFLLSPLSWNSAYETDNADNGYSLTDGNFFSQSDILFTSGEELKVKHRGDGVDKNGTFIVEIEVIGEVPLVEPHATVIVQPMEQDYVQTSANTLYSSTTSNVTVEGKDVPFYWNNSIRYDGTKGTMPYLVEKLSMKGISHEYNPETQNLSFAASAIIGKKFEDNQCPPGFIHDPNFIHCQDLNECATTENPCKQDEVCENTFGSYKCLCANGFKMTDRGCLDINECSTVGLCSHSCHNTFGSYRCSCPFGFYLAPDRRTCIDISKTPQDSFYEDETDFAHKIPGANSTVWDQYDDYDRFQEHRGVHQVSCPPGYFYLKNQCKDYDECTDDPNMCDRDEVCINFPGSYRCLSIPCPPGYQRKPSKNCFKSCGENKCQRGAKIEEWVIFRTATLKSSKPVFISLAGFEGIPCTVAKTRYRVTESHEFFEVKVTNGKGLLYASRSLNKDTLYRVKVEAFSYAANDALLYFTEFIAFVIIIS